MPAPAGVFARPGTSPGQMHSAICERGIGGAIAMGPVAAEVEASCETAAVLPMPVRSKDAALAIDREKVSTPAATGKTSGGTRRAAAPVTP